MRRQGPRKLGFLTERPIAHRGLHSGDNPPENSFAAFDKAIENGFGIELDVQLTADRSAVVFHDYDLERMTGHKGRVSDFTVRELQSMSLKANGEPIRSLREAVVHIRGRVPLLIEAKSPGRRGSQSLCRAIRRAIEGANSWAAVMSFDPRIVAWFREHSPLIVRGLVVTEDSDSFMNWRGCWLGRSLGIRKARPHFLAYDIRSFPSSTPARFRRRGKPVLTWTVRSDADRERAKEHTDQIIFERMPDNKT